MEKMVWMTLWTGVGAERLIHQDHVQNHILQNYKVLSYKLIAHQLEMKEE